MNKDYLSNLDYFGVTSMIKRLSDNTIADGRKLYRYIDIGIEPNWFLVFKILQEKNQTSVTEIASILKFAHPSVISIISKMEKQGYLQIRSSKKDKRKQIIELTSKAEEQLPEMQIVWQACEQAIKSIFDDNTFLAELKKMNAALEERSFFDRVLDNLAIDNIKITSFKTGDGKYFSSFNKHWLKKYFYLEPIDKMVLSHPTQYIINKDGEILMASYRDQTAGTVALLPKDESSIELCKMAVDPAFQGKGIGQKLMEQAIKTAWKMSFTKIFLYSNTKLEPAIWLYKKFGFQEVPLEPNSIYTRADIKMVLKRND